MNTFQKLSVSMHPSLVLFHILWLKLLLVSWGLDSSSGTLQLWLSLCKEFDFTFLALCKVLLSGLTYNADCCAPLWCFSHLKKKASFEYFNSYIVYCKSSHLCQGGMNHIYQMIRQNLAIMYHPRWFTLQKITH